MAVMTSEIRELNDQMEKARAKAQAILESYPNGLPAERRLEVKRLTEVAKEAKAKANEAQALEETKGELADIDRYLNAPERKVAHGINGDDDDRKLLRDRGWETKGGMIWAPTPGGPVAMWPEEVLFGPLPEDDPSAAAFFKSTRAAFTDEYKSAYRKHIRYTATSPTDAIAWGRLNPSEQKALSEGSDPAGGFLVPPDVQATMLQRTASRSVMRRLATVQPTSRDVLRWPRVGPHATSGSIYSSGFVGSWVGEVPTFSSTDPTFGTFDITIKKLRVASQLSNDLIADSAVDILAFLSRNGAENMSLVEDKGFIAGLGDALEPLGILYCGATTVDVEGSTTDTVVNTISNAGSAPKLVNLVYAVPGQYAENASWLMCRAIEGNIRGLLDANGRFLWPAQDAAFGATPRTLMGAPVYNSEFMPDDGTNANKVLVFGDISTYIIAQRNALSTTILRERYADTDQTGLIIWERVGGACYNPDALRIGIV